MNSQPAIPQGFVEVTNPLHVIQRCDRFISDIYPIWTVPNTSVGCLLSSMHSNYKCISPIIPFDGAGRYKLANGKIVNLDSVISCLPSDNIKSTYGTVANWTWEKDGTIKGSFNNISELYLIEKLPPEVNTAPKTCTVKINGKDICATAGLPPQGSC